MRLVPTLLVLGAWFMMMRGMGGGGGGGGMSSVFRIGKSKAKKINKEQVRGREGGRGEETERDFRLGRLQGRFHMLAFTHVDSPLPPSLPPSLLPTRPTLR
jgi:hypothetical protein